jgi:hypothetical protein
MPVNAISNMLMAYAACTVALFLTAKFSNFYGANMDEHPPEDAVLGKQPPVPADIARRQRNIMNNLENVPLDLALFWAALLSVVVQAGGSGAAPAEALALTVLICTYTFARIGFTVSYVRALQPHRTICFVLGTFSSMTAAGVLLSSAARFYMQ